MKLKNILFIARKDIAHTLRDRGTLVWLFLMPVLFFYFIGNATGGFGGSDPDKPDNVALLMPADAGFVAQQVILRLSDAGLNVVTFDPQDPDQATNSDSETPFDGYCRQLSMPEQFSARVTAGTPVELLFETCRDEIGGDFDSIRIKRSLYTVIADLIAAKSESGELNAASMAALNELPRSLTMTVRTAGKRTQPPSGFEQAVPGTMVMFTMLVLLTSGAVSLFIERRRGLLSRLASAPLSRSEIVLGKWAGKMALAILQIAFAMLIGRIFFEVAWQPDLLMISVLLLAWAGFCTSCSMLLGSVARSEGQVVGIGVLASMLLGGLGGCWWPIEVAPAWMQSIASLLPSGWTMNGLHSLMSFQSGAASALSSLTALVISGLLVGLMAVRYFRYQ